jgi:hypothetical protein
MTIRFHPHALERMKERGGTEAEVIETVNHGEQFPAKHGRTGFRHNFTYDRNWKGKYFRTKQVESYAVVEANSWLVITVLIKYF